MNEIEELAMNFSRCLALWTRTELKVLFLWEFCRKGQFVGASHDREWRKSVAITALTMYPMFVRWDDVHGTCIYVPDRIPLSYDMQLPGN